MALVELTAERARRTAIKAAVLGLVVGAGLGVASTVSVSRAGDPGARVVGSEFSAKITALSPRGVCVTGRAEDDDCATLLTSDETALVVGQAVLVTELRLRLGGGAQASAFYVRAEE